MQLPDILTDEGRAAIIACLRIAAQMGEVIENAEKDIPAKSKGMVRVAARGRNSQDFLTEDTADATQACHKRRKRVVASR